MVTRKLPYHEILDGIFEIDEFDCVSIFVIVANDRALVIDTGVRVGDLRWVIENRITHLPYDVVISYCHGDHTGGAGFFPRCGSMRRTKTGIPRQDLTWSFEETMSG